MLILENKDSPRKTKAAFREEHLMLGLLSMTEPTSIDEPLSDDGRMVVMQEELN